MSQGKDEEKKLFMFYIVAHVSAWYQRSNYLQLEMQFSSYFTLRLFSTLKPSVKCEMWVWMVADIRSVTSST